MSNGNPVVATWTERHDLVATLKALGNTNIEIAARLDIDPAYVSVILSDPRAEARRAEVAQRVADNAVDVGVRLKLFANEALETAVYWMRQRGEKLAAVSRQSAFGILDRAGYAKVEKHLHAHAEITDERFEKLAAMTQDANRVIEAFDYSVETVRSEEVEGDMGGDGRPGDKTTP